MDLPCKYPRFTRFITSLAVKLATSSTACGGKAKVERDKKEKVKQAAEKAALFKEKYQEKFTMQKTHSQNIKLLHTIMNANVYICYSYIKCHY